MKDFIHFLVTSIIDNIETVKITEEQTSEETIITISVPKSEMGKIIGKEGKVINAIRQLAKIIAIKKGIRINIRLAENAD